MNDPIKLADATRPVCASCGVRLPGVVYRPDPPERFCSHKCGRKGQPDKVLSTVGKD